MSGKARQARIKLRLSLKTHRAYRPTEKGRKMATKKGKTVSREVKIRDDEPKKPAAKKEVVVIKPPNMQTRQFKIIGTAPYVQLAFGAKVKNQLMENMSQGDDDKKKRKRPPRDFMADYKAAFHMSEDGWHGVPAAAFRASMIDSCRTVGFKMTHAKLAVFILADGIDSDDGFPLVKIDGKPKMVTHHVLNANGQPDIRVRAMWEKWSITLNIRYDADMFTISDVANLLARAGMQVGIGEGRPGSKHSYGMGWGTFELAN